MQKDKRTRRTKAEIEAAKRHEEALQKYESKYNAIHDKYSPEPEESKGLGDTVEKVFKATGIDKIAKFVLGEDCGCDERKEKLNKWFPYNKPNCLTEDEYNWLHEYYSKGGTQITEATQKAFLVIYNRVMNEKQLPTSCSPCYKDWHIKMEKIYNEYKQ